MNTTLRDALAEQINEVGPAHLDVDELVGLGEQRLRRRRRLTAALGSAAAVVLVIALAIGGAALNGSTDHGQGPTDNRTTDGHKTDDHSAQARPIVYSDDLASVVHDAPTALSLVGTLHVGEREVEIDQTLHTVQGWSMVVTDAGAVYAQDDHSVWFTDGGRPLQIAGQACAGTYPWDFEGLVAGNAGQLVAWFDCTPASRGDLVVYDTSLGHEVARHPMPSCRAMNPAEGRYECGVDAVIGEHVYFGRLTDHQFRFDVRSDQVISAGPEMYADDLRTHPRALVIGDSWRTGTPTEANSVADGVDFLVVGSRLVPVIFDHASNEDVPTRAFDTATGQPVRFRLPTGYHPDPAAGFYVPGDHVTVFEWLDDDTVALGQYGNNSVGDIITCQMSDGHCDVAVKEAPHDKYRIVPSGRGSLPG